MQEDNSQFYLFVSLGCVYGKGNQYTGKANVTVSGNECLPWADEKIAHQLRVNVGLILYKLEMRYIVY